MIPTKLVYGAVGATLATAGGLLVLLIVISFDQARASGDQHLRLLSQLADALSVRVAQHTGEPPADALLPLLSAPGFHNACLYINQKRTLEIRSDRAPQSCPDTLDEQPQFSSAPAGLWRYIRSGERWAFIKIPFTDAQGAHGALVVHALYRTQPTTGLLALLAMALLCAGLGTVLWCRAYLHRQRQHLAAKPLTELRGLCRQLLDHQDYKLRAADYPGSPYRVISRTFNQLLEELQQNENQLQEFAIQIQEKTDQLEAQRKLHLDRTQNLHKMFAGANHDLRQPLQAMIIFIGALKDSASTTQKSLIQKLEQVVDNLNHLFTDLLDLSKLESRMQRIPKQPVPIEPLLRKIYDEFEALAQEKRIEFRLYNRDLTVYSNPNMLERIIRNMISNAIRYTRTGGVLIGCRKRHQAIWIEVWDTGRGIPQEKMGEIFNEFVQIKDDDQEANKGVGLGLFIVKRLAQLLDHSIMVTSQLRKGTMFRVVVPSQRLVALPPSPPPPEIRLRPIETTTQPRTRHILLLDDDDQVRLALEELLQTWGQNVVAFAQLDELLAHLRQHDNWDLLISDFQLGDVDGLQAVDRVRDQLGRPLPALLITGTQDQTLLNRIVKSGIPWLKKPVKPAKLRALMEVIDSRGR